MGSISFPFLLMRIPKDRKTSAIRAGFNLGVCCSRRRENHILFLQFVYYPASPQHTAGQVRNKTKGSMLNVDRTAFRGRQSTSKQCEKVDSRKEKVTGYPLGENVCS